MSKIHIISFHVTRCVFPLVGRHALVQFQNYDGTQETYRSITCNTASPATALTALLNEAKLVAELFEEPFTELVPDNMVLRLVDQLAEPDPDPIPPEEDLSYG